MLHQLRWRKPPPDRRRLWLGLGIAFLLHGLFVWVTWYEMKLLPSSPEGHRRMDDALQVRLIPRRLQTAPPPIAPPPAVAIQQHVVVRPAAVREAPAKNAMTVSMPGGPVTPPTPAPALFDKSGQVLLPAAAASTAPAYVTRSPEADGDMQVMHHSDPVKYKSTRFEQYFPPPGESLGNAAMRHVVETVTKPHDVALPHGVHLKCTFLTGCQDPPPPPSPKSRDARLSMAPAKPLTADTNPLKPLSDEECIAIYRDGKPLPQGCPVDTPTRSVDADLRGRAAKGL
ncbi:hypothetical protein DVJ77_16230 [Dyella tabacisoli]|uniref:Uncharacterized protein n=2 Tax=Dyella tabacisoli TaxID=2282381 RepID=A0A369UJ80_9GAMM|nr:hypothetical protein DVJ77_16230 [Dyella tabacisoli]